MYEERYLSVPDGKPSIWAALERMAALIRDHDPAVTHFAHGLVEQLEARDPTLTQAELAAVLFYWVQAHMFYTDDAHVDPINAPGLTITDVIHHPDVLLDQILRVGHAVGDCDDYVVLLGSLYYDLGWGVTLVNVVQDGTDQEHVYLRVTTPDGVFAADAIIREPFGWELPPEERLSEAVVVV